MDAATALVLLATGAAAGFVSGLLGVGGGILMTPVLHYALGRPWAEAVGLSLLAIAVQSPLGVHQHARRGAVDWRLGALLAVGSLAGVAAGDRLLPVTPVPWLKVAFGALLLFTAWRLARGEVRPHAARPHAAYVGATGAFAGLVSRLFGVGGGIVSVPVLTFAGTPVKSAVGSSLVLVFAASAAASAANVARGLPWLDGLLLAVGALAAVPLGVAAAHRAPDARLTAVFAAALALVAVYVVLTSGVLWFRTRCGAARRPGSPRCGGRARAPAGGRGGP